MAQRQMSENKIERTERAYRQDLESLMEKDPIRAILELVTNCDDAYVRMTKRTQMQRGIKCKITIETERRQKRPTIITVKDRAYSMTLKEARENLGKEGLRTSGLEEGEEVRGFLGRGAKDVVHFGPVTWELKTVSGEHSMFSRIYVEDAGPSQNYDSKSLGKSPPKEHGTTVRLELQQRFKLPRHENLLDLLSRHFGMRQILLDSTREVLLIDRDSTGEVKKQDRVLRTLPKGKMIDDGKKLAIPEYPGRFATVYMNESGSSLVDNNRDKKEYWRHSLSITSGRATYDIFRDKFVNQPWAVSLERVFGSVDVPYINQLIKEYDDRQANNEASDPKNPTSLVKRDRTGLNSKDSHPFLGALSKVIRKYLEPHLTRMLKETEPKSLAVSRETQEKQKRLGRLIGQMMAAELSDPEESGGPTGKPPPIGLSFRPPNRVVEPNKPASLALFYRHAHSAKELKSPLHIPIDIQEKDRSPKRLYVQMQKQAAGYYCATIRIEQASGGVSKQLVAEFLRYRAEGSITWRTQLPDAVEQLRFTRKNYSLKDGARKIIKLLIPFNLFIKGGASPKVTSTGSSPSIEAIDRESGYDEKQDCGIFRYGVMIRGVGSKSEITAKIAGQTASTTLMVSGSGVSDIEFEYMRDEDVPERAWFSSDENKLVFNLADPVLNRYLKLDDNHTVVGTDAYHTSTMLAELVAYTMARYILQKKTQEKEQPNLEEPSDLFKAHGEMMKKWLPKMHEILLPDIPDLTS